MTSLKINKTKIRRLVYYRHRMDAHSKTIRPASINGHARPGPAGPRPATPRHAQTIVLVSTAAGSLGAKLGKQHCHRQPPLRAERNGGQAGREAASSSSKPFAKPEKDVRGGGLRPGGVDIYSEKRFRARTPKHPGSYQRGVNTVSSRTTISSRSCDWMGVRVSRAHVLLAWLRFLQLHKQQ